ncbi:MAG: glycosyltransferase [Anaerolineales bacterium]|nr:glycosyltransferase [Anaerolineales bacterium]
MPDGSRWPRVTVVTPSYNQAEFIEETIRSVLLQGYSNLEYIIMDGGSTDGSTDIIRKYAPWLSYWVSEPDDGQAGAIAEGWARATGDFLAYLNSDDTYLPGAIATAVSELQSHQDAVAVCGGELVIDRDGYVLSCRLLPSASLDDLLRFQFIPQPAVFLRREALERVGGLDTSFDLVFDYELWTRLAAHGSIRCVPSVLAATRWYPETKTLSRRPQVLAELTRVVGKVLEGPSGKTLSWARRRRMWAELSLVSVSANLNERPVDWPRILRAVWRSVESWPLTVPRLSSLVMYKAVVRPLAIRLGHWLRRVGLMLARDRVHWSNWRG